MEDLWNIKSFRNNLLLISTINLLVIFFAQEINEINVLWLIKINNINSLKVLLVLLLANLYIFRRYHQYILKMEKKFNYILLFKDILNKKKFSSIKNQNNKSCNINISESWTLQIDWNNTGFRNIFSNNKILCDISKNDKNQETLILTAPTISNGTQIKLNYTNNHKIQYLKFKFYLDERFFFDYYLPIRIWNTSLIIFTIKIIYESYNIL